MDWKLKRSKSVPKLKNRSPTSPTKGKYEGTPDASFTFTDDDFLAITSGKLNLHMAFIRGKLKIKGSISTAQKFTPDVFPKPSKL